MNIELKYVAVLVLASAAIGAAITARFVSGREVIKTQTVDHVITQNHIVTVVKEVDRPDGTKEITTTKDDSSVKNDTSVSKSEDKKAISAPNWLITGGAGLEFSGTPGTIYQAGFSKRLFGPVFVGVWGTKGRDTAGGVSATLEF